VSKQPILERELSMLKNRICVGLCIGLFALSPLGAATVSVLVMETGRTGENPAGQYPTLWENGLLDVFFESGHIVSNSPQLQLAEKPAHDFPGEARRDFDNAHSGGMEYFLVAIVDYTQANVSLRLFSTASSRMIHEQKYTVTTFRNTKEEYESIKKAVKTMAAYLK